MQVATFDDWFLVLQEKAGMRMDKDVAKILYDRGMGLMDALIIMINRRSM
jgi:hypothetical protein